MVKQLNHPAEAAPVGVQELIDQLKTDGIAEGRRAAEALVDDARQEALRIVDDARANADAILAKAQHEAQNIVQHGRQDLQLASRDALLKLKESFQQEFQHRFTGLVRHTLEDEQFLKQLILEVARRSLPDEQTEMRVLLSDEQMSESEQVSSAEPPPAGSLAHFVLGLTGDLLREGVTFGVAETVSSGIRVQLTEQDVELDFTEEAIATALMRFVSPRFRAMLEQTIS
jgi:V/A-type H+-transporting ATPase subunit E